VPAFTTNVEVQKTDPAVLYEPDLSTEPLGIWHEDHEIDGIMYRAANAQYNETLTPPKWQQVVGSQASYAVAQNTDGSVSYLYMPAGASNWVSSAWQGYAQPVTYYAVNYGFDVSASGTINAAALNTAIGDLITAGGGTLLLPAGTFDISGIVSVYGSAAAGIIIAGVSGQTQLVQQSDTDIFDVTSVNTNGGVRFRDLFLSYASMELGSSRLCAVNVIGSNFVTCEHVYFSNCPTAFQTDNDSEFCGLFNCWIYYNLLDELGQPQNDQTMVSLNGSENFVINCVIYQPGSGDETSPPTGCTAIELASNTATRWVSDTHIAEFAVGIFIHKMVDDISCTGVRINALQNAVLIKPDTSDDQLYGIHFTNCTFIALPQEGTDQSSGVQIGTTGGIYANVAGIYFSNCAAYGWPNAGIEIDSGQNIVITGGQYSSNGQNPSSGYLGAGIAVAGAAEVTISGVDCSGVNPFWPAIVGGSPPAQPCGIAVNNNSGDISNVVIDGCNLTGNANSAVIVAQLVGFTLDYVLVSNGNANGYSSYSTAVDVSGAVSNVRVTNCAGYNDRGAKFTPTVPTGAFYNTTFGYYGPIAFYVWGASGVTVEIGTLTTGLGTGAFNLPCNVSATIAHSGPPPTFGVIGM
jgi:hypothetical protein